MEPSKSIGRVRYMNYLLSMHNEIKFIIYYLKTVYVAESRYEKPRVLFFDTNIAA